MIPIIQPWTYTDLDIRAVDTRMVTKPLGGLWQELIPPHLRSLFPSRPDEKVCSQHSSPKYMEAYQSHIRSGGELSFADFSPVYRDTVSDDVTDLTLPAISFELYANGDRDNPGVMHMMGIETVREDRHQLAVRCEMVCVLPIDAIPINLIQFMGRTFKDVMANQPMRFRDGRVLRIREIMFPQTGDCAWINRPGFALLNDLESEMSDVDIRTDRSTKGPNAGNSLGGYVDKRALAEVPTGPRRPVVGPTIIAVAPRD